MSFSIFIDFKLNVVFHHHIISCASDSEIAPSATAYIPADDESGRRERIQVI